MINSIVKVELNNNDGNLPEFNYVNDQEKGGFIDDYSVYNGGSSIGEFDPMLDPFLEPWPLSVKYDDIAQLSMKDIEEITRSLDADNPSSFHQSTLVGATQPTIMAAEPQISHEQTTLVDANLTMKTTQSQYLHAQNMFLDAMPVYATITHHEPQDFKTHYGRDVYETTDQPQYFNNYYVDNFGNSEDVLYNSMSLKDNYFDLSSRMDEGILVDAEPIRMIPASTNHVTQCQNVSAAHDCGNVKNAVNRKSEQSSNNVTAMVKYEEGVSLRQNRRCKTSALELDEIRKYFNMPISKAAKELNVGPTVLKKRCRELNIRRWPHRKIKSLQCLIDNVKEMGLTNKVEVEMLEENKRMLEKVPELELSESTKRLRQCCFKANYKKRRLLVSSAAARR